MADFSASCIDDQNPNGVFAGLQGQLVKLQIGNAVKGSDYAFEPYLGMTITEMTVNIYNSKANQANPVGMQLTADIVDNNAEAEVPEPATYAYGVMGLASLLGMKRRIKK